jgi:hypothetical protein
MMPFQGYIDGSGKGYVMGTVRELAYRPALQNMLEDVILGVMASNDPARKECGAPDFILSRHKIDVSYVEAMDLADDMDKTDESENLNATMISSTTRD